MLSATDTTPAPIWHKDDCPGPDEYERITRSGVRAWSCRGCRQYVITYRPSQPAAPPTGWACRVHFKPVTWRGKGCAACALELAQSRRARRKTNRDTNQKES